MEINNTSSTSTSNNISNSVDKEKKFKEDIKKYFIQLNSGCYRYICYNPNCKKSNSMYLLILELKYSNQSEVITEAMKLAKSSVNNLCLDIFNNEIKSFTQFDPNTPDLSIKDNLENLALNFLNVDIKTIVSIDVLYSGLKFDLHKLKFFFKEYKEKYKTIEELPKINAFFSFHLKEIKNSKNYSVHSQYYLMYLKCRILIYISLHPFFGYLESTPEQIKLFFENFNTFKKLIKKINIDILGFFSDMDRDILSEIILIYQNFLSVYFLSDTRTDLDILKFFMKTFKMFYCVNEKYKILHFKEFYNEIINKNLDIKRDFDIYLMKLKKKIDIIDEQFCLLSYPWLFDSASKSEVLYYYNCDKQRSEVFNELLNISNNIHSNQSNFNLTFEVGFTLNIDKEK